MKKLLSIISMAVMLCTPAFGDVNIDSTTFPDAKFRSYVSTNFDTNADGKLSEVEISKAQRINAQSVGVMNLKGIEHLTALKKLICNYPFDGADNNSFNYTDFKAAYGLNCDIDDSYLLWVHIEADGNDGLLTPYVGDVRDTSSGKYLLVIPVYKGHTIEGISFRTRGNPAIEIDVNN